MSKKKIVVIGSGFAGLSVASCLAKAGCEVTILEKNESAGGRARKFQQEGFVFDMGPSWYWMPDVFESYFNFFGKNVSDYYQLKRLDPSYSVYFEKNIKENIPASFKEICDLFEKYESGSSVFLKKFLQEAAYKYKVGIQELVYKPSNSIFEFADLRLIKGIFKMHVFSDFASYIRKYFKHPYLLQLLEFPILFLGAMPADTPALYSLMNYADINLGTWYPIGGMHKIIEGMQSLAIELGVTFEFNSPVDKFEINQNKITGVFVKDKFFGAEIFVAAADYHHIEQEILPLEKRNYTKAYWDKRIMAPSSLIFYLGIDKKIDGLTHHSLFFDEDFKLHAKEIYETPKWPTKPLFYMSATSVTDNTVAPKGKENLFILIPVATDLNDEESTREKYYDIVMERLEYATGQEIKKHVIYKRSYAHSNFISDYNAFKGNAYGLANILKQTAILKPSIKSKKLNNLYYTGQLTVPGPGVPPSLISGRVVAKEILKKV
jgi:phytoene desaturase